MLAISPEVSKGQKKKNKAILFKVERKADKQIFAIK